MILKISKGDGNSWLFIDDVEMVDLSKGFSLNENFIPVNEKGEEIKLNEFYVDHKQKVEDLKVNIIDFYREGERIRIACNGMVYLMNNGGDTIEKLA